jgi:hypothetical protein
MTQTLTVNTARPNLYTALVASVEQPYTPKQFPGLVFGDTIGVNLYLANDARSGASGSSPKITITLDDVTPKGGTFTIGDGTQTTTALDWDATENEIEAALNALNANMGPFGSQVNVIRYSNGSFNIVFDTAGNRAALTVSASNIQPFSSASVLPIVDGSVTSREQQLILIKADPLVLADTTTAITGGWLMSLNSNNYKFMQATALEAISANYTIEITEDSSSNVDVVARGPVILEPSSKGEYPTLESIESINSISQGYYGLLSGVYFNGSATSVDIPADQVGIWQDVVMTVQAPVSGVHLGGVVDERIVSMKNANSSGHSGTGTAESPIVFLLEGLETSSSCTLRTSLVFEPDEDGGKLDSRILLQRHSGASPAGDFAINASSLSMESGADEQYPHIVNVQFFIGNTINTNGAGDAGKVRFQIKSDVAGTASMNKLALFTQT